MSYLNPHTHNLDDHPASKTLADMTAEVRALNIEKGWRTGTNTFGDYIALLHSELSEALEAYRDRRLEYYTTDAGKPDDVGSELADVLIRLLDMCDVYEIRLLGVDRPLSDVDCVDPEMIDTPQDLETFGDFVSWLHRCVDRLWQSQHGLPTLRALVTAADQFGVDLTAEYERKIAYNRTRPYQHGGRTLADDARQAEAVSR